MGRRCSISLDQMGEGSKANELGQTHGLVLDEALGGLIVYLGLNLVG